jgi:hypothetical protein
LGVFDCCFHNNIPRKTSARRSCNFLKRKRKKSSKHSIHSSLSVGRSSLHFRSSFLLF